MNRKLAILIFVLLLAGLGVVVFFFVPLNVSKLTEKGPPKAARSRTPPRSLSRGGRPPSYRPKARPTYCSS